MPLANIDDSALGRFRTSIYSPGGAHDYDTLVHITKNVPATPDFNYSSSSVPTPDASTAFSGSSTNEPDEVQEEQQHTSKITKVQALPQTTIIAAEDSKRNDFNSHNPRLVSSTTKQRFIHDAKEGPAPFTKPHIITDSTKAPFSGHHIAIEIPFGPDRGKHMHLPSDLSATEFELAALAIFWLWSGYRNTRDLRLQWKPLQSIWRLAYLAG